MTASDSARAVHHEIGQSLIELGPDGTTASAETYCTATTVNEADGQETWITFLVRYVDQFEKRDRSWKISHRFVAFDAVSDKAIMQYLPKANLGTRDEEDYSRKVLKDRCDLRDQTAAITINSVDIDALLGHIHSSQSPIAVLCTPCRFVLCLTSSFLPALSRYLL
ncbi:hypothetical protein FVEG_01047 [Fusarium verticillioides 7600]|uniref:SnoaL-like domain-containing protein n=1 Tax=Gibberella moniliformis (strain M3125 / FGSC 7600) TaxID=334819 RepID=W7LPS1_GIBM7|nr:hypothetical protein FVEG_01047 [Fusarium verticillioides 7600]EWG37434.1 hypothetical protein FVEG_01047 [Fusarium verticillioides 7600]